MNDSFLRKTLRRAVLLSLAVPVVAVSASCGGTVSLNGNPECSLASTTPVSGMTGGCSLEYPLVGHASDCLGDGGVIEPSACAGFCPTSGGKTAFSCGVQDTAQGGVLTCAYGICGTGRRPPGLASAGRPRGRRNARRSSRASPIACFLAEVAHLEAASVVAFAWLAEELGAHGAPARFIRAAQRAARDEERHADVTHRFAIAAGARPEPVEVAATPTRTLEAIAIDNAVEGCVRETFGAVLAMRQAEAARDADVRRAMSRIAREEARHAALSWELGRWLEGELDAKARRRVREERDRAVDALRREVAVEPHPSLVAELGVPSRAHARAALEVLEASLWS